MVLFNTIENKVRFYGKKIDLMWKKHKVILRICLRGFAFYTFCYPSYCVQSCHCLFLMEY